MSKKLLLKLIISLTLLLSGYVHSPYASAYNNPVIRSSMPDPAAIKAKDGCYYVYATDSKGLVPIYSSKDLVNWTFRGTVFSQENKPNKEKLWQVWAPDIIQYKGQYLFSYALSKGGEYNKNGICIATSDNPTGPFTDHGMLFTSDEIGVRNSIDPSFVAYKDKLYLLWGSFNGIYIIELKKNKSGNFQIASPDTKVKLAGNKFEGAHIFKHGKYYYLFASIGACCKGADSTYKVVVGRSKDIFGPYIDSEGIPMLNNGYDLVVDSSEKFIGPGHGSTIITDRNHRTWYLYHSWQNDAIDRGRQLMLDEILWDKDGWPYIKSFKPSETSPTPPRL